MAEQIPYGVAQSLISRLASAAFREFGRIHDVMNELERLKNTVVSIKAVLLDAEEKQQQNHAVKEWIRRLKDDVLYPADNLLDEFLIQDIKYKKDETTKNKVTKVLHSLYPTRIAFRHKMAHEIEKIQKKFDDIVKDMAVLNLNRNAVVPEQIYHLKRETGSYVSESDVIGREDDKNNIISLLRQPHENHNVSVVGVVGMGGLGKTALAQLVYNNAEVKDIFEESMWVCVSDHFDVKTIVRKILESLLNGKVDENLSLDNLQNDLRQKLSERKYLLVLDDIWNEDLQKWIDLRTNLMCGAQGSKVVVTTRSTKVAQTMGVSDPYVLKGLTPEESWSLLKKIITYGDETKGVSQILEPTGMKIAEKCRGVPLAIRVLGGQLLGKNEKKEWDAILQRDFWKVSKGEDSIMPLLKLSYQDLSPELRQCFAYCSLYPKDYKIYRDELVQQWMAQGYLDFLDEKQTMEDIGNQFVEIFLTKSFFQDAVVGNDGNIYVFKMHDLIHDLAMQVSGNDCCYLDRDTKILDASPMHVMLESDVIGLLESLDASRVRTLIFKTNSENRNEKELSVISKFQYLRILKLLGCSLSKLCDSIVNLKHLRYLELSHCEGLEDLFKSIRNIICLQTLILVGVEGAEFSTKDVSSLINLRYLHISYFNEFNDKKIMSQFGKLCMGKQYKGLIISKCLSSLTNIVTIFLWKCRGVQYLPPMECLPLLKSLDISYLYDLEYICYEEPLSSAAFFPSLENLEIAGCEKLKGWWRIRDDIICDDNSSKSYHLSFFPCLSSLYIQECPILTHMPTFPNLERLYFHDGKMDMLEGTLNMVKSNSSFEFPPLSMLKHLFLCGLKLEVKTLPNDWMQNLTSLTHLDFYWLPNETFQEIEIWFKDRLNYLPSLQNIEIYECSDLEALPVWICNILSLQHVTIKNCQILASLPDGMPRLTNLQTLEIIGCPLLIEECRTETSATWPKIAHIPNIILKESCY